MPAEIAIQVSNLSKCYQIYSKPQDRLKQIFIRNKKYYQEFWALKEINFEVEKGGSLGIIGRNGSGKSTLLHLLCKTLTPTSGNIEINGRIAALLELGAGFNPQFTGRENVYLNGSILGLKKREIDHLFNDIETFADIGDFIDQPVKVYSSGMFVRLAFSVQACVNPDILIIDEALSVGDFFFQQKCATRMQEMREQGTTLIFVSHDMSSIRDLCDHALFLKSGEMAAYGTSSKVIIKYFAEQPDNRLPTKTIQNDPVNHQHVNSDENQIKHIIASACWINTDESDKQAKLKAIAVVDEDNIPTLKIQMTKSLKFQILYQSFSDKNTHIAIMLRNRYDHIIHCSGTYTNDVKLPTLKMGEYGVFELEIQCMLEAGQYTFSAYLSHKASATNRGEIIDETPKLGPITVTWDYENEKAPWFGMFGLPSQARIITPSNVVN